MSKAKNEALKMNGTHYLVKENESLIEWTNFQFMPFLFVISFQCPEIILQTEIKLKRLYYYIETGPFITEEVDFY